MKTISVSQLKTHLSRELRKVGKGSSILVTDHDHPVAILSPVEKAIPVSA
jgi:antitoxin (DNA-binding transcriptional repressor) of toxin-antitoxin stability system